MNILIAAVYTVLALFGSDLGSQTLVDRIRVDGTDVLISKVAVDQFVSLRLDAQSDVELRGRVRRISHTVQRVSPENPLRVAHLDITLAQGDDLRLRPGMRFRGTIETERLEDVLLVPLDAATPTPDGPVVHRRRGTTVEAVSVALGARNAHSIVVTDGLAEGDEILRPEGDAP